ncbi:MAG: hypothetical protein HXY25_01755 [Alphaproteobacteria bacterium]|nr:hypothetical protein [Alphaproteobacteria bacterium]
MPGPRPLAPAFLDFEASGLGSHSWPIEVGWGVLGGEVSSVLIRPHPLWPSEGWDAGAEAVHGLTLDRLLAEGLDTAAVCDRLDADLRGRTVYSDAPEFDSNWLGVLYRAALREPPFQLAGLFDHLAEGHGAPAVRAGLARARDEVPPTHRAGEDVRHLMAVWRLTERAARGVRKD